MVKYATFDNEFLWLRKNFGYFRSAANGAQAFISASMILLREMQTYDLEVYGAHQSFEVPVCNRKCAYFHLPKIRTELVREVKFERINAKN